MEAIAIRGDSTFLMLIRGNPRSVDGVGRVFDRAVGTLHPELPVQSILRRGYWKAIPREVDTAEIVREARRARSDTTA